MREGEAVKRICVPVSGKVLVVGLGGLAREVTRELTGMGHEVLLTHTNASVETRRCSQDPGAHDKVEIIAPAEIVRFEGSPGRFHVRLRLDTKTHMEREVGAVIVATDCELEPSFQSWGLLMNPIYETNPQHQWKTHSASNFALEKLSSNSQKCFSLFSSGKGEISSLLLPVWLAFDGTCFYLPYSLNKSFCTDCFGLADKRIPSVLRSDINLTLNKDVPIIQLIAKVMDSDSG